MSADGRDPADARLGRTLGSWRLVAKLGEGGMGAVYRGEGPGGPAAIKVIRPELLHADAALRFQREAEASARVDRHPNVARVFGADLAGTTPWIAFELVAGGTLEDRLAKGPLEAEALQRLARELAAGLQHLHEQGVIHRDLKPANVLFRSDRETALIADFGLARIENGESLTQSGAMVGTPATMAPEQIEGRRPTPACDVWAFGVVLYQAATGRRPFQAGTTPALLMAIMDKEPAPPRELRPELDPQLASLILACLAKAEAERPADGAALVRLLETGVGPSVGRRRLNARAVGVLLILLIGLGVFAGGRRWRDERRRRLEAEDAARTCLRAVQERKSAVELAIAVRHLGITDPGVVARSSEELRALRSALAELELARAELGATGRARLEPSLESLRLRLEALAAIDRPDELLATVKDVLGAPPAYLSAGAILSQRLDLRPLLSVLTMLARDRDHQPLVLALELPSHYPLPKAITDPLDRRVVAERLLAKLSSEDSLNEIRASLQRLIEQQGEAESLRQAVVAALTGLDREARERAVEAWLKRRVELDAVLPILPSRLAPDRLSAALLRVRMARLERLGLGAPVKPVLTSEAARSHVLWLETLLQLALHDPTWRYDKPISRVLVNTLATRLYEAIVRDSEGDVEVTRAVYLRIAAMRLGIDVEIPKKGELVRWIQTKYFDDLEPRWRLYLTAVAEQDGIVRAKARRFESRFHAARRVLNDTTMPWLARARSVVILGELAGENRDWGRRALRRPGDPPSLRLRSSLTAAELRACLALVEQAEPRRYPRPDMPAHALYKGFRERLTPEQCQELLILALELHELRLRAGAKDDRARPSHPHERQTYDPYENGKASVSVKASYLVDRAQTARRARDLEAARSLVLEALDVQPTRYEALDLLFRLEAPEGRGAAVLDRVNRLFPRAGERVRIELKRLRSKFQKALQQEAAKSRAQR